MASDSNTARIDDRPGAPHNNNGLRTQKSSFCCLEPENCNWNTIMTLCFIGSNGITYSLWGNPLLPSFIFLATGNKGKVGTAEAVQGVTQVIAALLAGYLADRFKRGLILKAAAGIQLLAAALTILAIYWDEWVVEPMRRHERNTLSSPHSLLLPSASDIFLGHGCNASHSEAAVGGHNATTMPRATAEVESLQWYFILAACAMWGLYLGAYGPALEAIFADSVATGRRSKIYTWRAMLKNLCRGVGPLISLFAFLHLGNHWQLQILGTIMTGGIVLTLVPFVFLCLFRDSKSLKESSRSVLETEKRLLETDTGQGQTTTESDTAESLRRHLLEPVAGEGFGDDAPNPATNNTETRVRRRKTTQRSVCGCISTKHIPILILVSNFISALAAGMTVKFFPIFFQIEVCLPPIGVQAVYVITPVVMFFSMYASRKFAKCVGRIEAVQVERILGLVGLLAMAMFPSIWTLPYVILPIYILRTTFTSVGWPLINSVLNDYVAKEHRSKWNSLQSIAGLGWSGSAYFGGLIINAYGFVPVFYCTAAMQAVSILLRFFIIPLVPRSEAELQSPVSADRKEVSESET